MTHRVILTNGQVLLIQEGDRSLHIASETKGRPGNVDAYLCTIRDSTVEVMGNSGDGSTWLIDQLQARPAVDQSDTDGAPSCPWCAEPSDDDETRITVVCEEPKLAGHYDSSCCLFHQLLSDRTDEATFAKVQELINLSKKE